MGTLKYADKEGNEINYHILKTTYYEADPSEITGLNVDALGVLINPDSANRCKEMKIKIGMQHSMSSMNIHIFAGLTHQK